MSSILAPASMFSKIAETGIRVPRSECMNDRLVKASELAFCSGSGQGRTPHVIRHKRVELVVGGRIEFTRVEFRPVRLPENRNGQDENQGQPVQAGSLCFNRLSSNDTPGKCPQQTQNLPRFTPHVGSSPTSGTNPGNSGIELGARYSGPGVRVCRCPPRSASRRHSKCQTRMRRSGSALAGPPGGSAPTKSDPLVPG